MNKHKQLIKPLLLTLLFSITCVGVSNKALADSFPFNSAPSVVDGHSVGVSEATQQKLTVPNFKFDSANFPFLKGLELTAEQRDVFSEILNKQLPEIKSNVQTIEYARSLLRDMALAKTFDETVANVAADSIANGTAKLAVLQVEREYQILAMLTPEQVSALRK